MLSMLIIKLRCAFFGNRDPQIDNTQHACHLAVPCQESCGAGVQAFKHTSCMLFDNQTLIDQLS